MVHQTFITIETQGRGLYLITKDVERALQGALRGPGVLHCFLQHTSASLVIQENADPTAKADIEEFIDRLVPENQSWHRHLAEGPDDTVSHLKASITATSLTIPIDNGRLLLGSWQGLYLWEHRYRPHRRHLVLTVMT